MAATTLGGGDVDLLRRASHGLIHTALYALWACGIIDEEGIAGLLVLESLLGTGKCARQVGVEVSLVQRAVHIRPDEVVARSVLQLDADAGGEAGDLDEAIGLHKGVEVASREARRSEEEEGE